MDNFEHKLVQLHSGYVELHSSATINGEYWETVSVLDGQKATNLDTYLAAHEQRLKDYAGYALK